MKLFVIFSYQARLGIFFQILGIIIGTNHFYGLQGPNYLYRFNFTHFDEVSDLYGRLCDKNSNFPSFFSEKIPIFSMNAIGESN